MPDRSVVLQEFSLLLLLLYLLSRLKLVVVSGYYSFLSLLVFLLSQNEDPRFGPCDRFSPLVSDFRRSLSRVRISSFFSSLLILSKISFFCCNKWSFSRLHFARSFSFSKIRLDLFLSVSLHFSSSSLIFNLWESFNLSIVF